MGRIGQAIAKRCLAFNTTIGYTGPNRKPVEYRYFPDTISLASWADVLIAACPGGNATRRLVSAAVLDSLGSSGFFINIARGSVVDEQALVERLVDKRIAGAGLDVFVNEPIVPEELLQLQNVVLQPHIGSATERTRRAMGDLVLANLAAYFNNSTLSTPFKL
jgi:lactate dehydrogenase-like 2-hydroxyacid dehydrogenase